MEIMNKDGIPADRCPRIRLLYSKNVEFVNCEKAGRTEENGNFFKNPLDKPERRVYNRRMKDKGVT